MDVYQCLKSRLTIREFKSDTVPATVIRRILQAAQWSPSSRNRQPWRFIVIENPETLRKLSEIATSGRFIDKAPMAIAVLTENADRGELDAGRAIQQMELMAWAEGLGTCFVGVRDAAQNAAAKQLLGMPDGAELITVLPFGYRLDNVRGGRKRSRLPMSQLAFGERYGVPYSVE